MDLTESFPIANERVGGVHRLAPSGELDIATVPLLEAAFDAADAGEPERLTVDLSAITFIDSTGIQLLLRMNERAGNRLELVSSPAVDRLLDLTGLRDQLPIATG
jgi:anti-sigma B factor antagonist